MAAADQILTVAQMQAAEQALIDAGSSVENLMQIAGQGAAEFIWRASGGRPVTILCGPGNNGGDGYVIAETLRNRGVDVVVVAPMPAKTEAAIAARDAFRGEVLRDAPQRSAHCFVDCLFGSGLSRGLSKEHLAILLGLAGSHEQRIAVDLPSGMESDSGALLNDGLPEYDLTLALGAWKYAHFLMPSVAMLGAKRLVHIGVEEVKGAAQRLAQPSVEALAPSAHKYTRGMVGVVGGAMPGAASMAAQSAAKSGAGYVKLLGSARTGLPDHIVVDSGEVTKAISEPRYRAHLIGPGLGSSQDALEAIKEVIKVNKPCVMDADALRHLGPENKPTIGIATPHEGEFAAMERSFRLSGEGTKVDRAVALANSSGMVIVAKGPDTLVVDPASGQVAMTDAASSWLSTAGTGDILAGIVASRLAVTGDPFAAACQGVWLHSEAARLAGPAFTASDLIDHIPAALEQCL